MNQRIIKAVVLFRSAVVQLLKAIAVIGSAFFLTVGMGVLFAFLMQVALFVPPGYGFLVGGTIGAFVWYIVLVFFQKEK